MTLSVHRNLSWNISTCCRLTMTIDLEDLLKESEILFSQYCCKAVTDCFMVMDSVSPKQSPKKGIMLPILWWMGGLQVRVSWTGYNIERFLCALQMNTRVYDSVLSHGMIHSHCQKPIGRHFTKNYTEKVTADAYDLGLHLSKGQISNRVISSYILIFGHVSR